MSVPDAHVRLEYEAADQLTRGLTSALMSGLIYPRAHPRIQDSVDAFRADLHRYFEENPDRSGLRVIRGVRGMEHNGVPLGEGNSLGELVERLAERDCGGLIFRASVTPREAATLVDWLLADDTEEAPDLEGIEVLPASSAVARTMEAAGREEMLQRAPEFRSSLDVHVEAVNLFEDLMGGLRAGRRLRLDSIRHAARAIADAAFKREPGFLAGLQLPYDDEYTFNHSVNVAMIATSLVQPFLNDPEELARIAAAALLHDIGKSRIPLEILHKKGKLDDAEYELIKQHPEVGASLLLTADDVDPLSVQVAYCHHMRDADNTYPPRQTPLATGPLVDLIAAVDMFESLTARRPYKRALSVTESLKILMDTPGTERMHPFLRLIYDRLTAFPVGSEVILDTGYRATVVGVNRDVPTRPLVRVTHDADGEPLGEPYGVDLRECDLDSGEPVQSVVKVILQPTEQVLEARFVASV